MSTATTTATTASTNISKVWKEENKENKTENVLHLFRNDYGNSNGNDEDDRLIHFSYTRARARAYMHSLTNRMCVCVRVCKRTRYQFWNVGGRPSNCNRPQRWEIENKSNEYYYSLPFTFHYSLCHGVYVTAIRTNNNNNSNGNIHFMHRRKRDMGLGIGQLVGHENHSKHEHFSSHLRLDIAWPLATS